MTLFEMHYLFKVRWSKLDSNSKRDLTDAEIDSFLNNGIWRFVSNVCKDKLELTYQDVEKLSSLLVGSLVQVPLSHNAFDVGVREYLSTELAYPFFHMVRAYATSDCGDIPIKFYRHTELNTVLRDEFKKPSKAWRRLVGTIQQSTDDYTPGFVVYHAGVDYDQVQFEYIRTPAKVWLGTYHSIEYENCVIQGGSPISCAAQYLTVGDAPVECDINEQFHEHIVDLAVLEANRVIENQAFQLYQEKIQSNL